METDKRMKGEEVAKLLNIDRCAVFCILERLGIDYINANDLLQHNHILLDGEQVELIKNNLIEEDKRKEPETVNYLREVAETVGLSYTTVIKYARNKGWTHGRYKKTCLTDEQKAELLEEMKLRKAKGKKRNLTAAVNANRHKKDIDNDIGLQPEVNVEDLETLEIASEEIVEDYPAIPETIPESVEPALLEETQEIQETTETIESADVQEANETPQEDLESAETEISLYTQALLAEREARFAAEKSECLWKKIAESEKRRADIAERERDLERADHNRTKRSLAVQML